MRMLSKGVLICNVLLLVSAAVNETSFYEDININDMNNNQPDQEKENYQSTRKHEIRNDAKEFDGGLEFDTGR